MPQSSHDRAAEYHNLAAHAHAAAATAHGKGDHLTAHELTQKYGVTPARPKSELVGLSRHLVWGGRAAPLPQRPEIYRGVRFRGY